MKKKKMMMMKHLSVRREMRFVVAKVMQVISLVLMLMLVLRQGQWEGA